MTYHYDTGTDFYRLFLGKWMTYSSAYFHNQKTDLDRAQETKLELICRKLRLKPGERLLDIGCGWGGQLIYAAENYSVQALGVTLSKRQAGYGKAWLQSAGLSEQARIEVWDVESLREQYALTLRCWVRKIKNQHEQAVRFRDERTYRPGVCICQLRRTGLSAINSASFKPCYQRTIRDRLRYH